MKRLIFVLFAILSLLGCKADDSEHYTPPIATPSESLPLYELPVSSAPLPEAPDQYAEASAVKIVAYPETIYVKGSGKTEKSTITVESGTFKAESNVNVYGMAEDVDAIDDSPLILAEDEDSSKKDIQLKVAENGGLSFVIQAGSSPGVYHIYVSGLGTYSKTMQSASAGKSQAASSSVPGTGGMTDSFAASSVDYINTILSVTITILE